MGHVISKVIHVVERIVFPPLLIEDALIDHYKSELHSIQESSKSIGATGSSNMKTMIATVQDLQKQEFKARFLISVVSGSGALKKELKAPDLSTFSTKGYAIATTAVSLVQQVVTFVAMFLPEPIGIIVGLAAPLIGDVINETIQVVELSKEVDKAKSNQQKLVSTLESNTAIVQKTISQMQNTMKEITALQNQIFDLLKVNSWNDIFTSDKMTANFVQDLSKLDKITTTAEAQALVDKLAFPNEKTLLMQIWDNKQKVADSINKVNQQATTTAAVRTAARAFLSGARNMCNSAVPMLEANEDNPVEVQLLLTLRAAGAMRAKVVSLVHTMGHLAARTLGNTFSIDVYNSNKAGSGMSQLELQAAVNAGNLSLQSAGKVLSFINSFDLTKFDSFPVSKVTPASPYRAEFTNITLHSNNIKDRDANYVQLSQKMALDPAMKGYNAESDVHAIDVLSGTAETKDSFIGRILSELLVHGRLFDPTREEFRILSQNLETANLLSNEIARNFTAIDNAAKATSSGKDEIDDNTLRQYELAAKGLLALTDTASALKLVQSFKTKNVAVIMQCFSMRQTFLASVAPVGIVLPAPGPDFLSTTWCRFSTAFAVPGTALYLSPQCDGSAGLVLSHTPHFWTFFKVPNVDHGYAMFHEPPADQPIVFTTTGSLSPKAMVQPAGAIVADAASIVMVLQPVSRMPDTYYLQEAASQQFLAPAVADGSKPPVVGLSPIAKQAWSAMGAAQLGGPTASKALTVHHEVTATGALTINHVYNA